MGASEDGVVEWICEIPNYLYIVLYLSHDSIMIRCLLLVVEKTTGLRINQTVFVGELVSAGRGMTLRF